MTEIMPYHELKKRLIAIPIVSDRALLCTIYACMARVSEVVRGRLDGSPSLKVEDFELYDDRLFIYVKTGKVKRPRKIIIFQNRERWLMDIISHWANHIGEGEMFPFGHNRTYPIFRKYFPEFKSNRSSTGDSKHTIHWLRGWRYTHYRRGKVTGENVDSKVASLLGGWVTSAVPEKYYDFTKIDDYEDILENEPKPPPIYER